MNRRISYLQNWGKLGKIMEIIENQKVQKKLHQFDGVTALAGLEPATHGLTVRCSTN